MITGIKTEGKQAELKFQNHIIDSYKTLGGHAAKWASEWQKGKPDLICSLPKIGVHLIEVKHLPLFGAKHADVPNALSEKQKDECRNYLNAGALVWAGVVAFKSGAIGSKMALFNTQADRWSHHFTLWEDYVPGKGFDMERLVRRAIECKI